MSLSIHSLMCRQNRGCGSTATALAVRLVCAGIIFLPVAVSVWASTPQLHDTGRKNQRSLNEGPAGLAKDRPATILEKTSTFRNASWGMSPTEVKASESAQFREATAVWMMFSGREADIPVQIFYLFADDKLVGGFYLFQGNHRNSKKYFADFSRVKTRLEERYGSPLRSSDQYNDDPRSWGASIERGISSRQVKWETASTTILLRLDKDNVEANLTAIYIQNGQLGAVQQQLRGETSKSEF